MYLYMYRNCRQQLLCIITKMEQKALRCSMEHWLAREEEEKLSSTV